MTNNSSEKSLMMSAAAHRRWAKCSDPVAATVPGRSAFDARFFREADPDNKVREEIARLGEDSSEGARLAQDLQRRVLHLRKAYFKELALKSARARRK